MCGEIARAHNVDQLRKVYTYAYREADSKNDRSAMAVYIRAKDARKAALRCQ
jgi:hypothetical protein